MKRILCLTLLATAGLLAAEGSGPAMARPADHAQGSAGHHGQGLRPLTGPHGAQRHHKSLPHRGYPTARGDRFNPLPREGDARHHHHGHPDCELGLHGCEGRDGSAHGYF